MARTVNMNIDKWLGLASDDAGDTNLKVGECSAHTNWKVIDGYNVRSREGYQSLLTSFSATNIIINGNFADASAWSPTNATESAAANTYSLTGNGNGDTPLMTEDSGVLAVTGHKIYIKAKVKVTNAVCENIKITVDGTTGGDALTVVTQLTPTNGTTYTISGIVTLTNQTGNISVVISNKYADGATALNKVLQVKEVIGIDLTACFTAGFEETLANADVTFATWFNGTSTVVANQISRYTGQPIRGQWYGSFNGVTTHLFASNGHIYKNNGDGTMTDIGTLTDAKTEMFQFMDVPNISQELCTETQYDFGDSDSGKFIGQTFTPTRNATLSSISFRVNKHGSPTDNLVAKLYSTSAGLPNVLLATSDNYINGANLGTSSLWRSMNICTFYFNSIDLTGGVMYAISIERSGASSSTNYYHYIRSSGSVYSGGTFITYNLTTTTWNTGALDLPFQINFKAQYSIYIMNGYEYKKWDGTNYGDVTGYIPVIANATLPAGGGTTYEGVNSLNGKKSQRFNGDGASTEFYIQETSVDSIDKVTCNGVDAPTFYTLDASLGKVTFDSAPSSGTDNVEIFWTKGTGSRTDIVKKTNPMLYGGKNDNRVFMFGDGADVRYSGLASGVQSAEYFPALNFITVGSTESPVKAFAKQYDRLIIFKSNSTYWTAYEYDSSLGVQFPIYPLNDSIGCSTIGCVQVIDNNPFTMHKNKIWELVASNVRDERNMVDKSARIENLLELETMTTAITFDNQINKEYWLCIGNEAYIYNYGLDVWYYYSFTDTITSITYTTEMCLGTSNGQLMLMGDAYSTDNGTTISGTLTTGALHYGFMNVKKFVNFMWLSLFVSGNTTVDVYVQLDDVAEKFVKTIDETYSDTSRLKPKAKKFNTIKYTFKHNTADTVTILSLNAPAELGGYSK